MAPEFPPSLAIFNSRIEDGELKGTLEYVESTRPSQRLRIRWSVEDQPNDYRAFGGGVVYVYDRDSELQGLSVSEKASAVPLGDDRYLFTEGLQPGVPWLMFILILPQGYTLYDPRPLPVGTKIFKERLALYWMLRGDAHERAKVELTVQKLRRDIDSELIRLNNEYLSGKPATSTPIEVEDTSPSASADVSAKAGWAFLCYARKDREFVLKLAKDLKRARANVWMDQLDIRPGENWERAVEAALAACARMLVVLSPDSVESTNVRDEVSFALGQRKTIIPLLHRACTVPLRLHALEYVDFTGEYASALSRLLSTLGSERHTAIAASEPGRATLARRMWWIAASIGLLAILVWYLGRSPSITHVPTNAANEASSEGTGPSNVPISRVTPAVPQVHKVAVITENDGTVLTVEAESLKWGPTATPREITFKSGRSTSLEKIKAIDVLEVEDVSTKLQVTLIDGKTFEDSVDGGHFDFGTHFVGKTEKDSEKDDVNARIGIIKRVVIEH